MNIAKLAGEGERAITKIVRIPIETSYAEGTVNVFVLVGDPVTLIDCGIPGPAAINQLSAGLAKNGLVLHDLQQIVVTHMHEDHCGGVLDIQREVDIPVYVHREAQRQLEDGEALHEETESFFTSFIAQSGARDVLARKRAHRPGQWRNVRYVSDKDVLFAGGEQLRVLYTPGHSQSDLCLWNERTGDVFVGDFLLERISANAFISPPARDGDTRPKPLLQLRESLRRAYDLPFSTIYPGHGAVYHGHRQVIDKRFAEQKARCDRIDQLVKAKPQSVYELSRALFPFLQGSAIFLGLSEIQGHLDLLEAQEKVTACMEGEIASYRVHANRR